MKNQEVEIDFGEVEDREINISAEELRRRIVLATREAIRNLVREMCDDVLRESVKRVIRYNLSKSKTKVEVK